ncbi:MAG: hypothetical protein GY765_35170, partial [bacterium]|nr:hypothetical protein [bacterium]
PGLTTLIFGGIHGDEPGGYFSSEILSGITLIKGNLIIVPRVNYPSIMMNRRQINGDMNRKFVPDDDPDDPDAEVVKLLKSLMKEADIFINQHDAFGFHREEYISEKYNRKRYGQSLIIDCSRFYSKRLKKDIELGAIGQRIMGRVNAQIENKAHHFGFWDHNSVDPNSKFKAMKKSATYYALTTHSIPAFGLETSKDLPTLTHKVKYQLLVIKEILVEFGYKFVFPSDRLKVPWLNWVELEKNGGARIRVNGNTNLRLAPGDSVVIKKISSNYEKGLSANILKWGTINDMGKKYVFKKGPPAIIVIKKNNLPMGRVFLKNYTRSSVKTVTVDINGESRVIPNWGVVSLKKGHYFKIVKSSPSFPRMRYDVRGYSGKGRDDSGVKIYVKDLQAKYSFHKQGKVYFVKFYSGGAFAGGFQVELTATR